jgi:hypothetical protein
LGLEPAGEAIERIGIVDDIDNLETAGAVKKAVSF